MNACICFVIMCGVIVMCSLACIVKVCLQHALKFSADITSIDCSSFSDVNTLDVKCASTMNTFDMFRMHSFWFKACWCCTIFLMTLNISKTIFFYFLIGRDSQCSRTYYKTKKSIFKIFWVEFFLGQPFIFKILGSALKSWAKKSLKWTIKLLYRRLEKFDFG